MDDFSQICFVCSRPKEGMHRHPQVNLPICNDCSGTDAEKQALDDLTEGLAEGFVCGCI
ncbi:MAG: hypothetical protein LWW85_03395 [Marinilabiliales bacterium]|nr:hypothetical protein [Marinilabiliales bacterium]